MHVKFLIPWILVSACTTTSEPKNSYEQLLDREYKDPSTHIKINTTDKRYAAYFTKVANSIDAVWKYPEEAIRRNLQGQVVLQFTVLRNGAVKSIKVKKTSGHELLDQDMVRTIQQAAPFEPIPAEILRDYVPIEAAFHYISNQPLKHSNAKTVRE